MHYIDLARIRTASALRFSFLLIVAGLILISPRNSAAQQTDGSDKIEAISKRLEELEKQIDGLKRENAELRKRFGETEAPRAAFAAVRETPAAEASKAIPSQEENKPEKKESRIEFGGELRFRPDARANLNSFIKGVDSLVAQRVKLHAKAKLTDDITGFVEFQDSRVWGREFSPNLSLANVDLHQAYIHADHFLTPDLSVRIGRQELNYGNERLVGAFDWDNVGRSFDAIKAVYAKASWSADIFAARVVDGHGLIVGTRERASASAPLDFEFAIPHQDFYGAYLKFFNDSPNRKLEVYGFLLRDTFAWRGEVGSRTDTLSIYTMGTRQELKSDGGFSYDGEVAFQTGHFGPDDHLALALAVTVGKRFKSAQSPHFSLEYDFASGDGNFKDQHSREFINLFPNNHIHYGYADFLGWRNMQDIRLGFGFNPASKLSFDADYHKFYLHQPAGRWSGAAGDTLGFDVFGNSSRELGQELDFTLGFPYKERFKFLAGYSVFLPGRFAKLTRGADLSHFSYIQTLIKF